MPRKTATSAKASGESSPPTNQQKDMKLKEYTAYPRFSMAKNFNLQDYVTISNGMCGFMSVICSLEILTTNPIINIQDLAPNHLLSLRLAFLFPIFGLIFDFLDGRVARLKGTSSMLGQELDSLADLISFGVAPAVLGYLVGLRLFCDKIMLGIFVCAGLARLARYNVTAHLIPTDQGGKVKYFEGMPIPTSLIIVCYLWYCVEYGLISSKNPLTTFKFAGIELHYFTLVYALWSICMVSRTLKVPKL